jgi:general secretion pathway protein E
MIQFNLTDTIINYDLCVESDFYKYKQYNILPIEQKELYLLVATTNINQNINQISNMFNTAISLEEVSQKELEFEFCHLDFKKDLFLLAKKAINNNQNIYNTNKQNSSIEQFLQYLLSYVIEQEASDIHFEVVKNDMIIRARIDGELVQFFRFKKLLYPLISSLVKIYGNLDISQTRMPLNSRFTKVIKFNQKQKEYDFRISTMPTIYGESIVLRILNNDNIVKNLFQIGFKDQRLDSVKRSIRLSQGLLLVTGATGSGKTTTLYAMLNSLNNKTKKIITIEDPVEYKLDGIMQININEEINLDYHTVLKNILRQDPDILMIGEIRDAQSLNIAMQAALTGHLVIATLHTNSAIETITRLKDLKAQPYLISSTLKMVLSQKLLKKLCDYCKTTNGQNNFSKAVGCQMCNFTGYKGRVVVSEVMELDEKILNFIATNQPISKIYDYLKEIKFSFLKNDAKKLVKNCVTTLEEYYAKVDTELI